SSERIVIPFGPGGQDGKPDLFSTNTNNNSMGHNMPSLDVLCQSTFQGSKNTSVKSENDANTTESFKYCLTKEQSIHCRHPLGNCVESVLWEALRGRRKSRRNRVVLSMSQMSKRIEQDESLRNNTLMVVDTFKDESSRRHLASSIGCELPVSSDDPKELTYYMTNVAQFGFDHIIIIGEIENGMIFLDCYGRVFQWEEECQMLWPLGNSLEETMSNDEKNQVPWYWEYDGAVYEFKELLQQESINAKTKINK
ncbi:3361_t:CDS:2, partial [Dentiscutata erythropus]